MDELVKWTAAALGGEPLPTPAFRQAVGWSSDYDRLLEQIFDNEAPIASVAERALVRGRVILAGRGGSGKTVALKRLAFDIASNGRAIPVMVSLLTWNSSHQSRWEKLPKRTGARIDFLLEAFAPAGYDSIANTASLPRLLIVDSLNEVRTTVGMEMLDEFCDLVTYRSGWRVIVADRLVRRPFPPALPWALATLLPIAAEEQRRVADTQHRALERDNPLLGSAYFLNLFLKEQASGVNAATLLQGWFSQHSGLENTQTSLVALSSAALALYRGRSRTFAAIDLVNRVGQETVDALVASGAIVAGSGGAFFEHQLKHDFLVAFALMHLMQTGTGAQLRAALDVATFDASSFDVLALALQLAPTPELANQFVRATYDWNLYGTAYAVAEAKASGVSQVTSEMELVLMALLAEKRWDIFKTSSQKATDALRRFPQRDRKPFLEAVSLEGVFELVRARKSNALWYEDWVTLFCSPAGSFQGDSISLLRLEDILGWTAANVLRRLDLSKAEQSRLRAALKAKTSTSIRWRIVHLLGAFPTNENVSALFATLDGDRDEWVRYGAVRSLIELAVRLRSLRQSILSRLIERVATLREHPAPLRELRDALFVDASVAPASQWKPTEWKNAITPLVETFHDSDPTISGRAFWQRAAYDLRSTYE